MYPPTIRKNVKYNGSKSGKMLPLRNKSEKVYCRTTIKSAERPVALSGPTQRVNAPGSTP